MKTRGTFLKIQNFYMVASLELVGQASILQYWGITMSAGGGVFFNGLTISTKYCKKYFYLK